jgi:TPR repeat protein
MRRLQVLAIAALLAATVVAFADLFDDGLNAMRAGDFGKAAEIWRPLADGGLAKAQNNLGSLYHRGLGVKRDEVEAVRFYRAAAEQGLASAQGNLAFQYANGIGVARNLEAAVMWYRRAADQGNADAQFSLGSMYYQGQGIAQNSTLAYMWLSLAAAQGDQEAGRDRELIAGRMTPAQIAEGQRLARDWKATPPR